MLEFKFKFRHDGLFIHMDIYTCTYMMCFYIPTHTSICQTCTSLITKNMEISITTRNKTKHMYLSISTHNKTMFS